MQETALLNDEQGSSSYPIAHNNPTIEWFLTHCHIHRYPQKYALMHSGEAAQSLFYIVKGSVAIYMKDEDGREMILNHLGAGEFVGEMSLFEGIEQVRTASVKVKENSEIAEISYKKFRQLVHLNPDILMLLAGQIAHRLRFTSRKVGNLAFLDVTGRIAQTLIDLSYQSDAMTHPEGMQIRITRQEIGQMVGCSRETVGRVLKLLEDDGLIDAHGKTMVVRRDHEKWKFYRRSAH